MVVESTSHDDLGSSCLNKSALLFNHSSVFNNNKALTLLMPNDRLDIRSLLFLKLRQLIPYLVVEKQKTPQLIDWKNIRLKLTELFSEMQLLRGFFLSV